MLTLYHAPQSRSTRILCLLEALGALDRVEVKTVTIPRQDGSGGRDPENPHPEGKVPFLVHDGVAIRESTAIAEYLAELFPEAGLAPAPGAPGRGAFLGWMAWYAGVMEPVFVLHVLGIENPALAATFRTMDEMTRVLETALSQGDYLIGDRFTAADLIVASPFQWMPGATPDSAAIRDWLARCAEQPGVRDAAALEARFA